MEIHFTHFSVMHVISVQTDSSLAAGRYEYYNTSNCHNSWLARKFEGSINTEERTEFDLIICLYFYSVKKICFVTNALASKDYYLYSKNSWSLLNWYFSCWRYTRKRQRVQTGIVRLNVFVIRKLHFSDLYRYFAILRILWVDRLSCNPSYLNITIFRIPYSMIVGSRRRDKDTFISKYFHRYIMYN